MIDGKQYIVIAASGQRDRKGPQGAAYVVFALPLVGSGLENYVPLHGASLTSLISQKEGRPRKWAAWWTNCVGYCTVSATTVF